MTTMISAESIAKHPSLMSGHPDERRRSRLDIGRRQTVIGVRNFDAVTQRIKNNLATNVWRTRRSKGWTQEYLGERSGLGRNCIYRIEKSAANLTVERLAALALSLEMTVETMHELLSIPPLTGAEPASQEPVDPFSLPVGAVILAQPGHLALEFPAGQAFEAARFIAGTIGQPVLLVDPITRILSGVAGKLPTGDAPKRKKKHRP